MYNEDIDFEDMFRFPWELSEELNLLRYQWQNLYNQVYGRGTGPRADFNPHILAQIEKDFNEFRFWEKNLGLGQRFTASYNDELDRYKQILKQDLEATIKWLRENNPNEALPPEPNYDVSHTLTYIAYGIGVLGGGFLIYKLLKALK